MTVLGRPLLLLTLKFVDLVIESDAILDDVPREARCDEVWFALHWINCLRFSPASVDRVLTALHRGTINIQSPIHHFPIYRHV
jgi:hypothetical protein